VSAARRPRPASRPRSPAARRAVRYRVTDVTALGTQRVGVALIKAETYVRRDGRWLLLGGAETVLPADPPIAAVDPRGYDALVGRYEYAPGVAEIVTRDGPRRYRFVVEGGRATRLVFTMFGRDLVAGRVE
jgi:hypothetical protein